MNAGDWVKYYSCGLYECGQIHYINVNNRGIPRFNVNGRNLLFQEIELIKPLPTLEVGDKVRLFGEKESFEANYIGNGQFQGEPVLIIYSGNIYYQKIDDSIEELLEKLNDRDGDGTWFIKDHTLWVRSVDPICSEGNAYDFLKKEVTKCY
jgi:hypothetical protein